MTDLATTPAAGEATPAPEVEAVTPEAEVEGVDLDKSEDADGEQTPQPVEDETEEIEYEGKKYKVAKPLKGGFLMNADYTRKTQEVAEQRRSVEADRKAFEERQTLEREHLKDIGRIAAYDEAIAQYEKVNWAALRQQDAKAYDEHWFNYQQTIAARNKSQTELQTKLKTQGEKAAAEQAKRVSECAQAVSREIPGWTPEVAQKVGQFAIEHGFTASELQQVSDPRMVKILHAAYQGAELAKKAAAEKKAAAASAAKPLTTVKPTGGNRISVTDAASDKLSTEEWAKRRNEQVLKQRRGR